MFFADMLAKQTTTLTTEQAIHHPKTPQSASVCN